MKKEYSMLVLFLFLISCATPLAPKTPSLLYNFHNKPINIHKLNKITITDETKPSQTVNPPFGTTVAPFWVTPKTSDLVTADMRDYIYSRVEIKEDAEIGLNITIQEAEVYGEIDAIKKIPFLSLFAVSLPAKCKMPIKILFEVESKGAVIKSYIYENTVTASGTSYNDETSSQLYNDIIKKYRDATYTDLDAKFISRYL